eukprot:SAG31_NODE_33_length_32018_cov_69.763088_20_plen_243_part_00
MATKDPYYDVQREIKRNVAGLRSLFEQYQQRSARDGDTTHAKLELNQQVNHINWDLDDISDTISIVEKNRAKYKIDDQEIQRRKLFVQEMRTTVGRMKQQIASSARQPNSTESLLAGPASGSGANSVNSNGGRLRPSTAQDIGSSSEQQQMLIKQQDLVLDDVMAATKRIGKMGELLSIEIGHQGQLINEVTEDVDSTSYKLKSTQKKLEKLLQSQSENRLMCMVCMLIGAFIGLTMLFLYT